MNEVKMQFVEAGLRIIEKLLAECLRVVREIIERI